MRWISLSVAMGFSLYVFAAEEPQAPSRPMQRPPMEDEGGIVDTVAARGSLGGFGRPVTPSWTYSGSLTPKTHPGPLVFNIANYTNSIYQSETESLSVYLLGSHTHLDAPPVLPSGTEVPHDLGRLEYGLRFSSRLPERRVFGSSFSFGSASDHPLLKFSVDTISATGYYGFPSGERGMWVLSLFYSNNNPISDVFPIPGFMYIYRGDTFMGMFGVPFSHMMWRPVDPWMFSASIFGGMGSLEAAYGSRRSFQSYVSVRSLEQSFLRVERPHADDRLRISEKKACVGLRFPASEVVAMDLQTGYAFDRFVSEDNERKISGFSVHENSRNLGNSWFIALGARLNL